MPRLPGSLRRNVRHVCKSRVPRVSFVSLAVIAVHPPSRRLGPLPQDSEPFLQWLADGGSPVPLPAVTGGFTAPLRGLMQQLLLRDPKQRPNAQARRSATAAAPPLRRRRYGAVVT